MNPLRGKITRSPGETASLGEALGGTLEPGDVLAFTGELGSGKTTMIRGVVKGLGGEADSVSSPSFAIVHNYSGRYPIDHIDLYRIERLTEIDELGLWEIVDNTDSVTLIEWADKAPDLIPVGAIWIKLVAVAPDEREIEIMKRETTDLKMR